jgi:protein-arginine kinase activator protein McsA
LGRAEVQTKMTKSQVKQIFVREQEEKVFFLFLVLSEYYVKTTTKKNIIFLKEKLEKKLDPYAVSLLKEKYCRL